MSQRVLITGGAGFIGSHLTDFYLTRGHPVTVLDSLVTGSLDNLRQAKQYSGFTFVNGDVSDEKLINNLPQFDLVYHFASPASPLPTSPKSYHRNPFTTLKANSFGTYFLCQKAVKENARLIFASTSEVYGNPLKHPQSENYFGNVNSVGPRALYDESKRFGEACITTFVTHRNLQAGIVRIFNTYGPRLGLDDGRFISEVVKAGLHQTTLTLYGTGEQTRSFCYITDLIAGITRFSQLNPLSGTVLNLGNDEELTINQVIKLAGAIFGRPITIKHQTLQPDDPTRRQPDISQAKKMLSWSPQVKLKVGLSRMIKYYQSKLSD